MAIHDPVRLLDTLKALPRETEWLEFKQSQFDHDDFGKYMSGLANAAMLHDQPYGYMVFGIANGSHDVVGTKVRLKDELVGNQPFEHWVVSQLRPGVQFEIAAFEYDGAHVEIVRIQPAYHSPVRFKSEAYIRVDSVLTPLRNHSERERALWQITSRFSFEKGVAAAHVSIVDVLERFEATAHLSKLGAVPPSAEAVVEKLVNCGLLNDDRQGGYDATNLFVLLAAKDIGRYPGLASKVARVIHYTGTSKLVGIDDKEGTRGFGMSFPGLLRYIMDRVAHKEEMIHGTRRTVYAIPEIAVREFVVNALVHQDLTVSGAGPRVEIFSDRIRITNPGRPLVEPDRLIDAPARSRNEELANFMRRLGHFEGRGSGVDRAIDAIERAALAPPLFQVVDDSMVVTIFAAKSFAAMSKDDRVRACYQHAALRFESGEPMSNQSLRGRFGLSQGQYPQVSLVIADAKEAGLIKPVEEGQANRVARYLPYWA